jgi:hypothetical protein
MRSNYVLVSGLFNLDGGSKRSADTYISLFQWIHSLGIPTILYIDSDLSHKIKPRKELYVIPTDKSSLLNIQKIDSLDKDIDMKQLRNSIYTNVSPYYYGIISSKTNLLHNAKEYIINNLPKHVEKHLIWIDSGISHVGTISKSEFKNNIKYIIHDKINMTVMDTTSTSEIKDINNFLSMNRGKIAGGLISVPWNKIEWLKNEIDKLFDYSIYELKQYCLEEQFYAILIVKYREQFKFIYSDYWIMYNLKYIKARINTVINMLKKCSLNGDKINGIEILHILLKSINKGRSDVSRGQVCQILLSGFVISFYKDKELCHKIGKLIHHLYHNQGECRRFIAENTLVKHNLKFINIDLDKPPTENVLEEDYSSYIWSAL